MPGYSGTPLVKKLGIKPGFRLCVVNCPVDYHEIVDDLPDDVVIETKLKGRFDMVHLFATKRGELEKWLPRLPEAIAPDGTAWISWPKKAAKVVTNVTETEVREIGLKTVLVDVKVCAVTEIWSGLKFVIRKELREKFT